MKTIAESNELFGIKEHGICPDLYLDPTNKGYRICGKYYEDRDDMGSWVEMPLDNPARFIRTIEIIIGLRKVYVKMKKNFRSFHKGRKPEILLVFSLCVYALKSAV